MEALAEKRRQLLACCYDLTRRQEQKILERDEDGLGELLSARKSLMEQIDGISSRLPDGPDAATRELLNRIVLLDKSNLEKAREQLALARGELTRIRRGNRCISRYMK